jgi:hypothetical protein
MTLADFGRRFADWLGIEHDDPELALSATRRNVAEGPAALVPGVLREPTLPGGTQVRSRLPATRSTSRGSAPDHEIAELRRLVHELQSGLDKDHEA